MTSSKSTYSLLFHFGNIDVWEQYEALLKVVEDESEHYNQPLASDDVEGFPFPDCSKYVSFPRGITSFCRVCNIIDINNKFQQG